MPRTIGLLAALCVAAALTGCGDAGPKLYPLSCKVTLDGVPLAPKPGETAFVEFAADVGNPSLHLPRGTIGPDDTYAVTTTDRPGLEAGAWTARVVYHKESDNDKGHYAPPKPLAAAKFSAFATSGFRATAGPDTPHSPDFAVTRAR